MDSQVLVDELARLKEGQPGAESRVLFAISRASLYLLAADDVADNGSSQVVVQVRLVEVEGRPTAYIFSSIDALTQWCEKAGLPPNMLPIHGGDVSFLLPKDTWIQLDPGSTHTTILSPVQLGLVNQEPSTGMGVILAPEPDAGFVSPSRAAGEEAPSPVMYRPVESELPAPAPQGPAKRKFIPRSHPTTLFAAPAIDKKDDPRLKERSYTSSNLKKVIKSAKDDEG